MILENFLQGNKAYLHLSKFDTIYYEFSKLK
jgi:hypothetical protein